VSTVVNPVPDRRSKPRNNSEKSNRRRSTRVVAAVPVQVKWTTVEGFRAAALATTSVFNSHGALLSIKSPIALPFDVELTRTGSGKTIPARVIDASTFSPNVRARVAVELDDPTDSFWGIPVPPLPQDGPD
jgi:hypothetical protein